MRIISNKERKDAIGEFKGEPMYKYVCRCILCKEVFGSDFPKSKICGKHNKMVSGYKGQTYLELIGSEKEKLENQLFLQRRARLDKILSQNKGKKSI